MNLDEVRVKINDINDQMLALFKERMELSKDVAAAKKEMNKAIFLDRDGTLNIDYGYVHEIDNFNLLMVRLMHCEN